MGANYTRQTPPSVTAWLKGRQLQFREDWNLCQVADECYRRAITQRWKSKQVAADAVIGWATNKLAKNNSFTGAHWNWIVARRWDYFGDGYWRMLELLKPAIPLDLTWRKRKEDLDNIAQQLDEAASILLKTIATYQSLDVQLADVGSAYPRAQALVEYSNELSEQLEKDADGVFEEALDIDEAVDAARSIYKQGFRAPTLAHYLQVLKARLAEGLTPTNYGEFGAYPKRRTALRRAIIMGSLPAISTRRDKPATSPASFIEGLCTTLFGSSPAQADINNLIASERDKLWPAMLWEIELTNRADARREELIASGMSAIKAEKCVTSEKIDAIFEQLRARLEPAIGEGDISSANCNDQGRCRKSSAK